MHEKIESFSSIKALKKVKPFFLQKARFFGDFNVTSLSLSERATSLKVERGHLLARLEFPLLKAGGLPLLKILCWTPPLRAFANYYIVAVPNLAYLPDK